MNFETVFFLIVYGVAIYLLRGEVDRRKAEGKPLIPRIFNSPQYSSDKKK